MANIKPADLHWSIKRVQTGDFGIVRRKTFYGGAIRVMTSKGLHRAWGNHNFPIWEDPELGIPMTLQIETPVAKVVPLFDYWQDLAEDKGDLIVCRPDVWINTAPSPKTEKTLREAWLAMAGTRYDKESIWQIAKMYFRLRKNIPDNDKKHVYCTEGTFAPYAECRWSPEILRGERYPVPIHSEHILRQKVAGFVTGSRHGYSLIMNCY